MHRWKCKVVWQVTDPGAGGVKDSQVQWWRCTDPRTAGSFMSGPMLSMGDVVGLVIMCPVEYNAGWNIPIRLKSSVKLYFKLDWFYLGMCCNLYNYRLPLILIQYKCAKCAVLSCLWSRHSGPDCQRLVEIELSLSSSPIQKDLKTILSGGRWAVCHQKLEESADLCQGLLIFA